jgi:hypothetical protein
MANRSLAEHAGQVRWETGGTVDLMDELRELLPDSAES